MSIRHVGRVRAVSRRLLPLSFALTMGALGCKNSGAGEKLTNRPDASLEDDGGSPGDGGSVGDGGGNPGDGGGEGELPYYRSGSRLKAIVLEAEGMEPVFVGFHDTKLEVDCRFMLATDGKKRCLPDSEERRTDGLLGYLDATCTTRGFSASCAPLTKYRTENERDCSGETAVFRVKSPELGGPLYWSPEGGCEKLSDNVDGLHEIEAVPPDAFVSASPVRRGSGVLAREALMAEDGAIAPGDIVDSARDAPCDVLDLRGSGAWECVPRTQGSAWDTRWLDSACTDSVSLYLDSYPDTGPACEQPTVVFEGAGCEARVFELEAFTGDVYKQDGEQCVKSEGERLYKIASSPAALPNVQRETLGSSRVRPYYDLTAQGQHLAQVWGSTHQTHQAGPRFRDTSLNIDCLPVVTPEHGVRCAPTSQWYELNFADAACEQKLLRTSGCSSEVPAVAAVTAEDPCDKGRRLTELKVFEVTGRLEAPGAVYERDLNGNCVQSAFASDAYLELGTELSPAELAELAFVQE